MTADWDLPSPFIHRVSAQAADIDAYGHVNDSVCLRWLDETAWSHSSPLAEVAAAFAEAHHRRLAPGVEPGEI
ncbi:MAG: hypothetical protein WD929_02610 [Steroidobacteraceae bacterium]